MFEYELERNAGEEVSLRLRGDLVLGPPTKRLRACLAALTDRYQTIVIDASQVSRVDSAGLGELVRAYADVTAHGGTIRLQGATKRIRDVLVLSKLTAVFGEEFVPAVA